MNPSTPLTGRAVPIKTADTDHRAIIAGLAPPDRARLIRRSDAGGLFQAAMHIGSVLACGMWIALRLPYWPALVPVQGILVIFLFCALHEAIHNTPFRTDRLNSALAWVCGAAVLIPPNWFRYFHFAHHRHTQDPERDPELAAAKPDDVKAYLVHLSGIPTWARNVRTLLH